jgi:hypothetical protein
MLLAMSAAAAAADQRLTIEVDEKTNQFRISVETDKRLKIIPLELQAPHGGFPPRAAGVLVQNARGEIIGCGEENTPSYAAESSSSSISVKDLKFVKIVKGQETVTPWFYSQDLFFLLDQCVMPERRGGYVNYQIVARINTNKGQLTTSTGWMPIRGFEPEGRGIDVPPIKDP